MLSRAIWAVFLSILIQTGMLKKKPTKNIVYPILGGGGGRQIRHYFTLIFPQYFVLWSRRSTTTATQWSQSARPRRTLRREPLYTLTTGEVSGCDVMPLTAYIETCTRSFFMLTSLILTQLDNFSTTSSINKMLYTFFSLFYSVVVVCIACNTILPYVFLFRLFFCLLLLLISLNIIIFFFFFLLVFFFFLPILFFPMLIIINTIIVIIIITSSSIVTIIIIIKVLLFIHKLLYIMYPHF